MASGVEVEIGGATHQALTASCDPHYRHTVFSSPTWFLFLNFHSDPTDRGLGGREGEGGLHSGSVDRSGKDVGEL